MMRPILMAVLLALPAAVAARDWQVVPGDSSLGFTGQYQGGAFKGTFRHFNADIAYDPADLADARFEVTVKLDSVDTQSEERDQTLAGSDFFDTGSYPTAHFVTDTFSRDDRGQVVAHGTLDLHGRQHPVDLHVRFQQHDGGAVLEVDTTLDRLDYGLGSSDDWSDIARDVPVHAHLRLR